MSKQLIIAFIILISWASLGVLDVITRNEAISGLAGFIIGTSLILLESKGK